MINKSDERMERVGFKLPIECHRKNDPRGREYGFFSACWIKIDVIEVIKYSQSNVKEFAMYFESIEDFESWASDCT